MPLVQITPGEDSRETILIYGAAGSGKTRLATSLPERFGKVAYIALDDGSENLASVLPTYRDRITVFRPGWEQDNHDPVVDLAEVAIRDWKKDGFNTVVLDTFSNVSWKILNYCTKEGKFQSKHNSIGVPGKPGFMALPDKGDYGGVQGIIRNFVSMIMDHQPGVNIIFVCHEATDDSAGTVLGGPATVGRALVAWLPARFSTVIRLDRVMTPKIINNVQETTTKHVAKMSAHFGWIARRNEANPTGNPLKSLELNPDPVNFWEEYDKVV